MLNVFSKNEIKSNWFTSNAQMIEKNIKITIVSGYSFIAAV